MDIEILARLTDRGQFPTGSDFTQLRDDLLRQNKFTARGGETRSHRPVELDKQTVAAALAGVSRPAYLYALMTVCGDQLAAKELIGVISAGVGQWLVKRYGDRHRDQPTLYEGITQIIMFDRVGGVRCDPCRGTGLTGKNDCRYCSASGWRRLTDAERARMLGKTAPAYSQSWASKVERLEQDYSFIISGWVDEVERRLRKNLKTLTN